MSDTAAASVAALEELNAEPASLWRAVFHLSAKEVSNHIPQELPKRREMRREGGTGCQAYAGTLRID